MSIFFVCDYPPRPEGHGTGALNYHLIQALGKVTSPVFIINASGGSKEAVDYITALHLLGRPELKDTRLLVCGTGTFQLCFRLARHLKIPVVMQCMYPPSIEQHNASLKEWNLPPADIGTPLELQIEQEVLHEVALFISPIKRGAESFCEDKGVSIERVCVAPYGVSATGKVNDLNPEGVRALYVSQVGPGKGHQHLLYGWSNQSKPEWHLRLVGSGSQGLSLEGLTMEQRVRLKNAEGLGLVSQEQLLDTYRWCNIYVHPSLSETYGLPVLEAMSFGRPVIVNEGTGVSEYIEDGKEGLVVKNASEILEGVQYFADNPSEMVKMGQRARLKASSFTWERFENIVAKAVGEVIGRIG